MDKLTKKTNIFKCCIDKLTKRIYNKIRLLYNRIFKNRILAVTFTVLLAFQPSFGGNGLPICGDECGLVLDLYSDGGELIYLTLSVEAERTLCGVLAELKYDADRLRLVSCSIASELSEESAHILCIDEGYSVRLVCDGEKNILAGRIAELVFLRTDSSVDDIVFEISPIEAYFWEKDELLSVTLSGSAATLLPSDYYRSISVFGAEIVTCDSETALIVRGRLSKSCVAAGFEVILVEFENSAFSSFCLVSVLPQSGGELEFSGSISLPDQGEVLVSVCPIAYGRLGYLRGERRLYLIRNGTIICENSMYQ